MSKRKATGLSLLVAFVAAVAPGTSYQPVPVPLAETAPAATVPAIISEMIQEADPAEQEQLIAVDITLDKESDLARLKQAIHDAGGEIVVEAETFVRTRIPPAAAQSVAEVAGVSGVGINGAVGVDSTTQAEPAGVVANATEAGRSMEINLSPIGAREFQRQYGVTGRNLTVAVIDSGIDPGHPALQTTADGRPKVVDWKDYTNEGFVSTRQIVAWGGTFTAAEGGQYRLPDRPAASQAAKFGYLEENLVLGYINQDLDRNGQKTDRFGVLLVDATTPGRYDTAYIDTNRDGSFRDEQPLRVFREQPGYVSLGQYRQGQLAERRLNMVVADLDPAGMSVQIGFDSHGHGTWVSGVLGGYSPAGYQGVAPGVQIMALKVLKSTTSGDWFHIKDAIQYAASHGASVINVSIGDLASGAAKVFDSGASNWLDRIASEYGVLIVLAAGNSGPGLSSGLTVGNSASVLAAGGYFSPEMWQRDYGWVVPHGSVWFFSGMGPRSDGTYLPSVVAPAGSPAPSPLWRDAAGYRTATGTSVATPHISGAAALLMEAGRQAGTRYDWASVKQALEMGAQRVPGFDVYEQGQGLVQLAASFNHLRQIGERRTLEAGTAEGNGGVLARSYTPGSSAFYLTNTDNQAARVTVLSLSPWVRPALSSMLLPPAVKRSLPLQIDPQTQPGVYSTFLTVTQQDRYGPILRLPVTQVRPYELNQANGYQYTNATALEVGRYQRYFFQVPANARSFNVTAQVAALAPPGEKGTVQVHVFRPDGQIVHAGKIGVAADAVTTLFQTREPAPGSWEVVVVALPDGTPENTTPRYSLGVSLQPGAIGTQPLKFSVAAGSETTVPLRISNVFEPFTGAVEAIGLSKVEAKPAWNASLPWRVVPKQSQLIETFTLREFTSELLLEVGNPTRSDRNEPLGSAVDLSLSLYRVLPQGGVELRGQSTKPGQNNEVVRQRFLPAGTYQVVVTTGTTLPVQFHYRRLVGVEGYNLQVNDESRRHGVGDVWTPTITIKAPAAPGRYTGWLVLRDTDQNQILAWYPIEVSVGQPALTVQPMAAQLSKGRPGTVVLEVRNSETRALLSDISMTVNGQRYLSRNGQISVPVTPQADSMVVDVEADVPGYQFVKAQLRLPVKDAWGVYPLGIDKNEENSSWRRKVTTQLP
ncbi:MAG: putative serine protease [Symbiobacteriaceae bacterium]|nr:putative serine protease [Symbiobacteriaceae bacterium]